MPDLPPDVTGTAFRLAIEVEPDELEHHLAGVEEWQLERLLTAAVLLDGAVQCELGRRHS